MTTAIQECSNYTDIGTWDETNTRIFLYTVMYRDTGSIGVSLETVITENGTIMPQIQGVTLIGLEDSLRS